MKKFLILLLLFNLSTLTLKARVINFSGITWTVRNGYGGPGPNNWSDSTDNVWVDASGYLHLKIRKVNDTWYCSEIYANESFGYAEYLFYLNSNVENYNENIIVGLFTYESDTEEIDIEFSKWGDPNRVNIGQYVVQPYSNSGNIERFSLNLNGDYSTHKFIWKQDEIFYQSYHGHYPTLPSQSYLIHEWTYNGSDNPPAGNERLHLNFWLQNGTPPSDSLDAELIIQSVSVKKETPLSVMLSEFNCTYNYGNTVLIKWTTLSETNNSHWHIYRSFTPVFENSSIINQTTIAGTGNSSNITHYSYLDSFDFNNFSKCYYWLKSVSYNGTSKIFGPVQFEIGHNIDYEQPEIPLQKVILDNYPNPFNPNTQIKFMLPEDSFVKLEIFNHKGKKLETLFKGFAKKEEFITKRWNAQNYPNGLYFYKLTYNKEAIIKKMILLK